MILKVILGAIVLGIILVIGCTATCALVINDAVEELENTTIEDLSESLANDQGREFMLAQPCVDVMAEYNAMVSAGHDAALSHVSNVYNIKTGTNPYIAISDAQARVAECR